MPRRPRARRQRPRVEDPHAQDPYTGHWAMEYARRLADRHPPHHRVLIQTSMSPSGYFHVGNFRDTVCAHLVHRALRRMGRRSAILLSFDDYDPVRTGQAVRDPELAGHGGRPLGEHRERAARICRTYLAELRAMGILPPEADQDGRTPPGGDWRTHYQYERYRAGAYRTVQRRYQRDADRLAALLGKDDGRDLFAVYCLQCGRNTTEIHRLDRRAARYRCLSCGAELTARDPADVKPSWALDWTLRVAHESIDCEPAGQDHVSAGSTMDRTLPVYERYLGFPQPVIVPYGLVRAEHGSGKISGSRGGGPYVRDLLAVHPVPLVLWLYARRDCLADLRLGFGPAAFLGAYEEFDRFARSASGDGRARDRVLWELLTDEEPDGYGTLPRMRTVLGALYAHGCAPEAARRHLAARHPGADGPLLTERIDHAHAWLTTHGRDRYWPAAGTPADGGPADGLIPAGRQAPAGHQATAGHRAPADPAPADPQTAAGHPLDLLISQLRTHTGPGAPHAGRTRAEFRQIYGALFGTEHGPRLDTLADVFGPAVLADALEAYRARGERPLCVEPPAGSGVPRVPDLQEAPSRAR
ncbi:MULTISPECIES: lysine--tRNA ligase [unclassified Streptomyces]|uniref:lysine--tRNA ligase n=1 Tax=unclassified Streptomyces TaxID=2593676 RepID=UPI0033B469E5